MPAASTNQGIHWQKLLLLVESALYPSKGFAAHGKGDTFSTTLRATLRSYRLCLTVHRFTSKVGANYLGNDRKIH
jgi:hypothetical protein